MSCCRCWSAGASRADAEQRARAALDKVGLLDKAAAEPPALSGGEQQRVAIARAIVNRPQIILADEPTANLDRASANQVLDALQVVPWRRRHLPDLDP